MINYVINYNKTMMIHTHTYLYLYLYIHRNKLAAHRVGDVGVQFTDAHVRTVIMRHVAEGSGQ